MADNLAAINDCEVCGAQRLVPVLDLGEHPMCDDLVPVGDGRRCKEYPIDIAFCPVCKTAHQRFQIPKQELFPQTYHYRSHHTADVINGMRELVAGCEEELGSLQGRMVCDVGCNDGSLLSLFGEKGARTFGIEPTGAAADAIARGHTVAHDFLTEDSARAFVAAHGRPDIITFTNVFAHIEDLKAVIRSLMILGHGDTAIVIENHYMGAVLERRQFDTFYHEHPRTYSYTSFTHIADDLGRVIARADFPKRYGGNIRVMLRPRSADRPQHNKFEEATRREEGFQSDFVAMARDIEIWRRNKTRQMKEAVAKHGKLPAKAFPGRSAIPIKLIGLDETMIDAVYEKPTSAKVGHYVPGTRIPIRSDDDFDAASAPGPLVNMAWHIAAEIQAYMRKNGYQGEFIDIIAPEDFAEE